MGNMMLNRNNMKAAKLHLLIITVFGLLSYRGNVPCPKQGNSGKPKFEALDTLKNRTAIPKHCTTYDIAMFFDIKNNEFWKDTMYCQTIGFLKLVKFGGEETCESRIKDTAFYDYHLEVIPYEGYIGKPMIFEITRFVRCVSWKELKKMAGHPVIMRF